MRVVGFVIGLLACRPPEGAEPGQCSNLEDDDRDGQFDCFDLDCGVAPECAHDTDADTDTDTDADSDADTDADSDADTDADTDADSDTDADADTDVDADSDTDADADTDVDADSDADVDADTDVDVDTDTDVDADTDVDTGSAPSVSLTWSSSPEQLSLVVEDPQGRMGWDFGLANTPDDGPGWTGEDCMQGGPTPICHTFGGSSLLLDRVADPTQVVAGVSTFVGPDTQPMTYFLRHGGECWVWGHFPPHFVDYGFDCDAPVNAPAVWVRAGPDVATVQGEPVTVTSISGSLRGAVDRAWRVDPYDAAVMMTDLGGGSVSVSAPAGAHTVFVDVSDVRDLVADTVTVFVFSPQERLQAMPESPADWTANDLVTLNGSALAPPWFNGRLDYAWTLGLAGDPQGALPCPVESPACIVGVLAPGDYQATFRVGAYGIWSDPATISFVVTP